MGSYNCGAAGDGGTSWVIPHKINGFTEPVSDIAIMRHKSYAVTQDGQLLTWGAKTWDQSDNECKQLYQTIISPTKASYPDGIKFKSIHAYLSNAYAITTDGIIYAYGHGGTAANAPGDGVCANASGGVCPANDSFKPISMPEGVKFTAVSNGHTGSYDGVIAVDSTGSLWGWGSDNGKLGTGAPETSIGNIVHTSPVKLNSPTGVKFKEIAAGGNFYAALDEDGEIYTWGFFSYESKTSPTLLEVAKSKEFKHININMNTAYPNYILAITTDGKSIGYGQVKQTSVGGGTNDHTVTGPVATIMPKGVQWDSADGVLAIDQYGRLWGWNLLASDDQNYGIGDGAIVEYDSTLGGSNTRGRTAPVLLTPALSPDDTPSSDNSCVVQMPTTGAPVGLSAVGLTALLMFLTAVGIGVVRRVGR